MVKRKLVQNVIQMLKSLYKNFVLDIGYKKMSGLQIINYWMNVFVPLKLNMNRIKFMGRFPYHHLFDVIEIIRGGPLHQGTVKQNLVKFVPSVNLFLFLRIFWNGFLLNNLKMLK